VHAGFVDIERLLWQGCLRNSILAFHNFKELNVPKVLQVLKELNVTCGNILVASSLQHQLYHVTNALQTHLLAMILPKFHLQHSLRKYKIG